MDLGIGILESLQRALSDGSGRLDGMREMRTMARIIVEAAPNRVIQSGWKPLLRRGLLKRHGIRYDPARTAA